MRLMKRHDATVIGEMVAVGWLVEDESLHLFSGRVEMGFFIALILIAHHLYSKIQTKERKRKS